VVVSVVGAGVIEGEVELRQPRGCDRPPPLQAQLRASPPSRAGSNKYLLVRNSACTLLARRMTLLDVSIDIYQAYVNGRLL
jgi:hypothetical protein